MSRIFVVCVLVGFIVSCKDVVGYNELPPLYISAQLVVGDTIQYIFVDRPRSPDEPRGRGFNDAYVEVSDGDTAYIYKPELMKIKFIGEFMSGEGEDSVWLYKAKFSPKPLTKYTLKVIMGGDTATATTITPDTFSFNLIKINPDSTITIVGDTVSLPEDTTVIAVWRRPEGAHLYYAYVYNYDKRDSILDTRPNRYIFIPILDSALIPGIGDSLRGFPPFLLYKDPAFDWGSGTYTVKIWALNEDRFKWAFYDEGNIKNAMGIFASVSQSARLVYVKKVAFVWRKL